MTAKSVLILAATLIVAPAAVFHSKAGAALPQRSERPALVAAPPAAVAPDAAAKTGDGKLILREDFGALANDGLPSGWEAWTPQANMKLRIEAGSPVAYRGKNSVRMSGDGNQHAKGSIRRQLTGLSPEKFYRFVVVYSTKGIPHAHNSVYPFVTWGENKQFQLLTPTGEENGWLRAELVMPLPPNAKGALTVELLAGWIPDGSVYWGELIVTELARYEPPRNPVRVAVIDSKPAKTGSLLDNADFYAAEIGRACARERLDVILLPEHFNTTRVTGASEVSLDSEYLGRLKDAAKKQRVNLIGSVHLRENGFLYNTALFINRQGQVAGKYHKTHLATPEALFTNITRGSELEVIETDFGKIGILVCWDYHFPEAVRTLVLRGAEMLFVPLAGDGRLLEGGISMGIEYSGKAIVLDNRVPVVFAVTNASTKNPSVIINTKAQIIARSSDQEHIISGVVDTKERVFQWTGADFESVYRSDRRPELYGPLVGSGAQK